MKTTDRPDLDAARSALDVLDGLVRDRPRDPFPLLSQTVRYLSTVRDGLIRQSRDPRTVVEAQRLAGLNAVVSVAVGAQFPVAGVKWDRIQATRDALDAWLRHKDSDRREPTA